ncbi:thiamine diphosphokinase [Cognatishimia sp. WU-CL00825]|uniref:thiamine diphosphokinase n=1 Tax=Cognatishimia sp. WU-CL00825 TaxID=3127658 RepID=UPI0033658974
MIVQSLETVTLVGAGLATIAEIARCEALGPTLVAADGGAAHCLAADRMPDAVIGDMDSLGALAAQGIASERLHAIPEQDSTDFDKALRNITAPLVLGVGFCGARMDHQLACYNVLVRQPHKRCVLLGDTDVVFLAPPNLKLDLQPGTRVSLFPLGLVEGVSDGLKWPIAGLNFTPDGRIGTSNAALGPVEISVTGPKLLVILPRSELENVVQALLATPGAWPAL